MTTMSSVSISKKPSVITLTDSAITKVTDLLAQEGNDALALRVAVRPGGCSGYSYEMFFDSESSDDDVVTTQGSRSRWSWTRPAPSSSRAPPSSTATASRGRDSTSRTPTPPAPAGAVPPSADPTRRAGVGAHASRSVSTASTSRFPTTAPRCSRSCANAGTTFAQGRLQPPGPVRLLHGLGRRRPACVVCHPGPAGGRSRGDDPRRARPRRARQLGGGLHRGGREPVRLLHAGDHHALWPLSKAAAVSPDDDAVGRALAAHLCRCTGWQTIVDAARQVYRSAESGPPGAARASAPRDLDAAARRAALEGGTPQRVGADVACGGGGFAEDTAPADALVAVPDGRGGFVVGASLGEARALAERVPGRNSTVALRHPLEIPPGTWDLTLRTTFVEPGYLEPDASWCEPGGEPFTPLANGGAFGGKVVLAGGRGGPSPGRRDGPCRAGRVLTGRRRAVRAETPSHRGRCPG